MKTLLILLAALAVILIRDCQGSSDWKENLLIYCTGTDRTDYADSVLYDVRYGNPYNQ